MHMYVQALLPAVSSPLEVRRPRSAEEFCASYAALVSRFAVIVAPNRDEADDIAQESLLKAISRLQQFDPTRGDMNGWLWKIVVNEARDGVRRSIRRRLTGSRWAAAARAEIVPASPDRLDESLALEAGLKHLRQRDRELLALRFGADLEIVEVAAAVGLQADSCGRALRRAIDRLREALASANNAARESKKE
jgi:RNA polymerase sigma-70 factor (ECF subfamily)